MAKLPPKSPYELRDTKDTKATFSADEINGFAAGAYAAARRRLYLQKMSERGRHPLLDEFGREVLSPISVVADVDMHPLTTRQNISRFMASDLVGGDGFDEETDTDQEGRPVYDDRDYYVPDRTDGAPSPHEVRSHRLSKKLSKARDEYRKSVEDRRKAGDTDIEAAKNPPPPPKTLEPTDPPK